MSFETPPSSQSFDIEHLEDLLRPIREIAAVWDIPLKEYLDSYLNDLSNVDLSKDFDPKMLNFSQAGLFLQGSTNVLAKKVKNLYDLVINSSASNSENNENNTEQKKRKKKVIEFVVDDKLVDIDDLVECDPTMKNDADQSQFEITTMPKIPFCLLSSLDSSKSSGNSYRINEVPSQDYCVILLDKSIKFNETENAYKSDESDQTIPSILNDDYNLNNSASFQSPQRIDNLLDSENLEKPDMINIPENNENAENNDVIKELEDNKNANDDQINNNLLEEIPVPPELPDDKGKYEEEEEVQESDPKAFTMLDPNSTELQFTSRPFKKMKKIRIPTTFLDDKRKAKKVTKKPFHDGIFIEIFEKGKRYREKRTKEEDKEALEILIPEESGLDHVLKDIDTFIEPPLPPIDLSTDFYDPNSQKNDFNGYGEYDGNPINNEIIIDNNDDDEINNLNNVETTDYRAKCQEIINRLIQMGKMQVHQTHTAEVLENWEKKVTPILEEEVKHKPFFVPDVQEWVKDTLMSHNGSIYFRDLTSNVYDFEISRIFLAILMLGNAGEVILPSETPPTITNDFLIKLAVK
ncbi:Condensin-2 complex subunit H2 [Tritrichomonas musculus]|uniref:Condensin-2 complex subunit H2 n=1 Tax=Tritrichomonas musculus TaxID=1915356 RepID=A0ABR2K2Q5_9EUKA